MVDRKLPESASKVVYTEGFLSKAVAVENRVGYGYQKNHLPDTSRKTVSMPSSFDVAKRLSRGGAA